jgi:hypothetical protein
MQIIGQDSGSGGGPDLLSAVKQARRGFRRDVAALLEALEQADLLIPLAEPVAGATTGERTKVQGELRLQPHFLPTREGPLFAALFTSAPLLDAIGEKLGWRTGGEGLEFCSIPGGVALEMAVGTLDEHVHGIVRRHFFENVGRTFLVHFFENSGLCLCRHLLERVGGELVIKRLDDLGSVDRRE